MRNKLEVLVFIRIHLEEGRSLKGLAAEYGVSKASISIWTNDYKTPYEARYGVA